MNYLVKMTPLEPYAFGSDKTAAYAGADITGKSTYFVRSKDVPEQTTILGMLRYIILEEQGLLKSDYSYTPQEKELMRKCIGPSSFQFSSAEKQDFGLIHSISPLFLIDGQDHVYIRNPFHNKGKNSYQPMVMDEAVIETSAGEIRLPANGEYDAKEGHGAGYYDLADGTVHEDLFQSVMVTGNRKNGRGVNDDDCFFKRELKCLKEGFSFAVYVEADNLPSDTIAYMGQKRSAFRVTVREAEGEKLTEKVETAFAKGAERWEYALSDLVAEGPVYCSRFSIVEEKHLQNLETVYDEKQHARRLRRSRRQYNMIQSGSVFYGECPLNISNENCRQIGYNYIVRLGGR